MIVKRDDWVSLSKNKHLNTIQSTVFGFV